MQNLTFSHRGNLGDIIYALPAIKACCMNHGCQAVIVLVHDSPALTPNHPFGASNMPEHAAKMLKPLLLEQEYVCDVRLEHNRTFQASSVDYPLDDFRDMPDIDYWHGNIPDWYIHLFTKYYNEELIVNLKEPWLSVDQANFVPDCIGVCRSSRYRNDDIDYSPLQMFGDKVVFFGLADEFNSFRRSCPSANLMIFNDFFLMAKTIAGCRWFFGNQTFIYSIAEAMKIKRYLEVSTEAPNVQPINNGTKILNQKDFESAITEILKFR